MQALSKSGSSQKVEGKLLVTQDQLNCTNCNKAAAHAKIAAPKNFSEKSGDLLQCNEQYIMHQTNCLKDACLPSSKFIWKTGDDRLKELKRKKNGAKGALAANIFRKFTHARVSGLTNCQKWQNLGSIGDCGGNEIGFCMCTKFCDTCNKKHGCRRSRVGKAYIHGTATFLGGKRFVVNLFGKLGFGKIGSRWHQDKRTLQSDGPEQRRKYFRSSLQDFKRKATTSEGSKLLSVAFPSRIGCGVAGGDWNGMRKDIIDFATENPTVRVVIYKLKH